MAVAGVAAGRSLMRKSKQTIVTEAQITPKTSKVMPNSGQNTPTRTPRRFQRSPTDRDGVKSPRVVQLDSPIHSRDARNGGGKLDSPRDAAHAVRAENAKTDSPRDAARTPMVGVLKPGGSVRSRIDEVRNAFQGHDTSPRLVDVSVPNVICTEPVEATAVTALQPESALKKLAQSGPSLRSTRSINQIVVKTAGTPVAAASAGKAPAPGTPSKLRASTLSNGPTSAASPREAFPSGNDSLIETSGTPRPSSATPRPSSANPRPSTTGSSTPRVSTPARLAHEASLRKIPPAAQDMVKQMMMAEVADEE